jgi:hypothetical protein
MADGSLQLQAALVLLFKGATDAGARVYDEPPSSPTYPIIQIGESQAVIDDYQCRDGSEEFIDVHVWSQAVGWPEIKRIAAQVKALVHAKVLMVPGYVAHSWVRDIRYIKDPDGKTRHGVITVKVKHHS